MTHPDELEITLAAVAAALDRLSVPWAIGGSLASAIYGEPRATNGVDLVCALSEDAARAFVAALGTDFYADADAAVDAVRRHASFNVIDNRTFLKVDLFVPRAGPLGVGQLDRRRRLDIGAGRPLPVLGPEDTLLQKLEWYMQGGQVSDRQWRDIVSVLRLTDGLDNGYLDDVARHGGLTALLERARREACSR